MKKKLKPEDYFRKEEQVRELEEKIKGLMLEPKDCELLKRNKGYKKLKKNLELYKEQAKIMKERLGDKIGQHIAKQVLESVPWFKPYRRIKGNKDS